MRYRRKVNQPGNNVFFQRISDCAWIPESTSNQDYLNLQDEITAGTAVIEEYADTVGDPEWETACGSR